MGHVAGRITSRTAITSGTGNVDLESAAAITVYGYTISEESTTKAVITFSTSIDNSGKPGGLAAGTVFKTIVVQGDIQPTVEAQVAFMADNGLRINVTEGTVNVSIHHSAAGG